MRSQQCKYLAKIHMPSLADFDLGNIKKMIDSCFIENEGVKSIAKANWPML
jgi:hypothetical protein